MTVAGSGVPVVGGGLVVKIGLEPLSDVTIMSNPVKPP